VKNLSLLLADDKSLTPLLAGGLPPEATHAARHLTADAPGPNHLFSEDHLADLPRQRWGVVLPKGRIGDDLREAIRPLIEARAAQQGTKPEDVRIYQVDPGLRLDQATAWMERDLLAPEKADRTLPRYLLFLGDLDKISLETQQVLSARHYTGRLAFSDLDGREDPRKYDAYAKKVLRWEEPGAARKDVRAVAFSARGDDPATRSAYDTLMKPARERSEELFPAGHYPVQLEEVVPDHDAMRSDLLELAQDPGKLTLLWSMSHGAGVVRRGDADFQAQRERQGAPVLGDERLTSDLVEMGPFLPGGFWFLFACFGVGTPSGSAYLPWLKALVAAGNFRGYNPDEVLRTLPREGESAFIAATPKAALANPDGPLAVLGHIDLAWSFSFDELPGTGTRSWQRFLKVPEKLLGRKERHRAGEAVAAFMGDMSQINQRLTDQYGEDANAALGMPASRVDPTQRGLLWMLRQDLGAYLLLGDPAVRLPLAPQEKEKPTAAMFFPGGVVGEPDEAGKPSVEGMVTAVMDTIRGRKGPAEIAAKAGLPEDEGPDEVARWVEAYKKAGEAAMDELHRGRSG
jgi:hypothetical protein